MGKQLCSGAGVALVTPFKNGAIDFESLERIIEHVIAGGIDFLVSLGTTGESVTLSFEERRKVLDFTIQVNAGRKPLVVGVFGDNNTQRVLERIQKFDFKGIDAIMASSPAYNKPNQEGIFRHYMAMESVAPRPIILYNVPGRTSCNMEAATTLRLAKASSKFIAVKEASGDLVQAMEIMKARPDNFLVLSGEDPVTLPLIAAGGDGAISVIANAFPKDFSGMVRATLAGDLKKARVLNDRMLDIHPWLYIDGNPAGIKATMEMLGLCSKEVRLPLFEQAPENIDGLRKALQAAGYL
jgi:4-hydroxy-tetrahydrodipicolinate synthase